MENKALVNKIINFSNVDGEGNRTAIFFQGCPFKCLYCHNPETITRCLNCGICVSKCPSSSLSIKDKKVIWDKNKCVNCDTCISVCPNLSSPKVSEYSVNELMEVIKRNKPFIRGITVSGGECMMHSDFIKDLFVEVKKLGLTTFIDSNGYYDFSLYEDLLKVTDKVMLDVKAFDNEFHKKLTSKSNEIVLKNLHFLLENDLLYEVRTVILNNQTENNLYTVSKTAEIINDKCRYKLIRYRHFGVREEGKQICGYNSLDENEFTKAVECAKKYMKNIVTV